MAVQSPPIPMQKPVQKPMVKPLSNNMAMPVKSAMAMPVTRSSTPLSVSTNPESPPSSDSLQGIVPGQSEKKSRTWLWILLGILGLLIISAIGVGLYLWLA